MKIIALLDVEPHTTFSGQHIHTLNGTDKVSLHSQKHGKIFEIETNSDLKTELETLREKYDTLIEYLVTLNPSNVLSEKVVTILNG